MPNGHSDTTIEQYLQALEIHSTCPVHHNLSYDALYTHETDAQGLEQAHPTATGALCVYTGKFTGRSAKDKYLVCDQTTEDTVWWKADGNGADNQPMSRETFQAVKTVTANQLAQAKSLYVVDAFCGANPQTRLALRLVTEVAWAAHFVMNMFIAPTDEERQTFSPDWTIMHSPTAEFQDFQQHGMRSSVFAVFNISQRLTCIGGTWYGGEIKKGMFTMMNYFLPQAGIGSFHCSANEGVDGDTALFFGLSGTGKTTLSADPKRRLIGDDEHGWDDRGVFNFEGGCYAKTIDIQMSSEPDIYKAIRRNALLENVPLEANGAPRYADRSLTENTRVSYPIDHIDNIVPPPSRGTHARNIIFLTCDAFGVLPPVAKLSTEQAKYYYLNGYTAKVAGTELGVTEPTAAFSACFGGPFLALHPTRYGELLGQKMAEHGAQAWLVNTGWSGGGYGRGQRMSLSITRRIIDAIFDSTLMEADYEVLPVFNLSIPAALSGVPAQMLNPRNTWANADDYDLARDRLAQMFVKNFTRYTDTQSGLALAEVGPQI